MQIYLKSDSDKFPGKIIFSSSKKWLHPLFELEEFLSSHSKPGELFLRDRIIGRAAAFLILRMGIKNVESDVVSLRALSLFKENSVAIKSIETVDKINCITEDLLENNYDCMQSKLLDLDQVARQQTSKELGRMLRPDKPAR